MDGIDGGRTTTAMNAAVAFGTGAAPAFDGIVRVSQDGSHGNLHVWEQALSLKRDGLCRV